jgi:type IV secretion system protein TrbL
VAGCGQFDPLCTIISQSSQDALTQLVNNVVEAVGKGIAAVGSLWVLIPTPEVSGHGDGNQDQSAGAAAHIGGFTMVLGYAMWVSLIICVLSLIAAGALLSWRRRHGDGMEHIGRLGVILLAVILISAATGIVSAVAPFASANSASTAVAFLQNSTWWIAGGLAILSIIVAAARMAWTQRAQAGKDLVASLLTLIVVAGGGVTVIGLLSSAGDGFSVWILNQATGLSFGQNMTALLAVATSSGIGLIALLILGTIATLMMYVQIGFMILRGGLLVVLAGGLPIAASFTSMETGRQWFKRYAAWIIAFLVYKPAAAFVYAAAFQLAGSNVFADDGTGLVRMITGVVLMLVALLALPALLRLAAPVASAIGGGGTAAAAAAGAMVGGGAMDVATGAVRKASSSGGGDSGGPGGSSSASGASTGAQGSASAGSAGASAAKAGATGAGGGAAAGGAAAGGAAAGGAAAGGAAAAAGPVGAGVIAAQKVIQTGQAAAGAVKSAVSESADGASGS